jgi:hypothetical protein
MHHFGFELQLCCTLAVARMAWAVVRLIPLHLLMHLSPREDDGGDAVDAAVAVRGLSLLGLFVRGQFIQL